MALGFCATVAITSPVEVSCWRYLHLSFVPVADSKPSLVPLPASRPIRTISLSFPPSSFQLVISPVYILAICSTVRSDTAFEGFTIIAIPSRAMVVSLSPFAFSSSLSARLESPMSQRPSSTAVMPEPEPVGLYVNFVPSLFFVKDSPSAPTTSLHRGGAVGRYGLGRLLSAL